jgi:MoxR-like ATPase
MAIITHRVNGEVTEAQHSAHDGGKYENGGNATEAVENQRKADASDVLDEYIHGSKELHEMQGWELKRLGEACKSIIAEAASRDTATATDVLSEVRKEWGRRKQLERDNPEAAKAEAANRDEISERTGKPKKLPRGKPFQRGEDERRNTGDGEGEGDGESDGEGDSDSDSQSESKGKGKSQSQSQGDGEADQKQNGMPDLPSESTEDQDGMMESIMRRIAREEDYKVVSAVDANFTALAKELARVAKLAASGGSGGKTIIVDKSTERTAVVDGHPHEALEKCVKAVRAGFRNILLVGPAGSGKSTLGKQLAKVLADLFGHPEDFALQPCSVGVSESVFFGRLLPVGENGAFSYVEPDFVRIYENGGVFIIDELDASDANVMVSLNDALGSDARAQGASMSLPARMGRTRALRSSMCVVIGCANTWGHGADRMYVGRNQLDAATLRRFSGTRFSMDYDRALEKKICADTELLNAVWEIRDKVKAMNVRRVWGTGELVAAATWRASGMSVQAAIRTAMGDDWSADDLAKVGMNANTKPKGAL